MSAKDDEFVSEAPDEFPPGISDWPYEQRLQWAQTMFSREGLILKLLARANYSVDEPKGKDWHLTKEELAAIYLSTRGVGR